LHYSFGVYSEFVIFEETTTFPTILKFIIRLEQLIPYRKKDKWGYCTPDKKIVIDCIYDDAEVFSEGLALVTINGEGLFFIDRNNKIVIPKFEFGIPDSFFGGLAKITRINEKGIFSYTYIDIQGRVILPFVNKLNNFSEDLASFSSNNKFGFINRLGQIVIPCLFEVFYENQRYCVGKFSEGLCSIKIKNHWCYINKMGGIELICDFDNVGDFSEGIAIARKNNKWGFIDKKGIVVIPFQYDMVHGSFSEGLTAVRIRERYGFINNVDETVIPFEYRHAGHFSEGLVYLQNDNDLWGFINKTNDIVIPFQFDELRAFSEGLAIFRCRDKWGYINMDGEIVIPSKFDIAKPFSNGLAEIENNYGIHNYDSYKSGYINKSGDQYWED